jgi:hypothetical protein
MVSDLKQLAPDSVPSLVKHRRLLVKHRRLRVEHFGAAAMSGVVQTTGV